jgi:hypothetical protein
MTGSWSWLCNVSVVTTGGIIFMIKFASYLQKKLKVILEIDHRHLQILEGKPKKLE